MDANVTRNLDTLQSWIDEANKIVFFGGAGVSTESGVPDFRSKHGIYEKEKGAEEILTYGYMAYHPKEFWAFYKRYFMMRGVRPNKAHLALAELEAKGKLSGVITQNVDNLHQAAGSRCVCELHGSAQRYYCTACGEPHTFDEVYESDIPPRCHREGCDGLVRPDIVMYGEGLDNEVIAKSLDLIRAADLLIIGGTSMTVYPAAGFVHYRRPECRTVLINRDPTGYDGYADLVIHGSIGEMFGALDL